MISTIVTVNGIEDARKAVAVLHGDTVKSTLDDLIEMMAQDAATYPPELPNQRYERTYTLRDGWLKSDPVFQIDATSANVMLVNSVEYAPDVQGAGQQARIHQGRWETTEALMERWEDRVADAIEAALVNAVDA